MAKVQCVTCRGQGWWCTAYGQTRCECSGVDECKTCSGKGYLGEDDPEPPEGEVTFDKDEMIFIRAIFTGECNVSRLKEGGDYMKGWIPDWNEYDLERFLNKITGDW